MEYGNNNEYLWSKPACGYLPEIIKLGVQVKKKLVLFGSFKLSVSPRFSRFSGRRNALLGFSVARIL